MTGVDLKRLGAHFLIPFYQDTRGQLHKVAYTPDNYVWLAPLAGYALSVTPWLSHPKVGATSPLGQFCTLHGVPFNLPIQPIGQSITQAPLPSPAQVAMKNLFGEEFPEPEIAPQPRAVRNNDGQTSCVKCGAATKTIQLFISSAQVCTKCGF